MLTTDAPEGADPTRKRGGAPDAIRPSSVEIRRLLDIRGIGRSWGSWLGYAAVLLFVVDGTAWAIPSPDVMVSLFASAAQVLALASVVFGKWFFDRRTRRTESARSFRLPFYASLGLCAVCSIGWFMYATSVRDDRVRRLQVNLNRDSRENGRTINDVSLKELPFSQQLKREDGITTQALSDIVSDEVKMPILDIRESEEFEMGRVAHTSHVRFPDLMAKPDEFLEKGKPALLLCFNGNRSSELCSFLQPLGFDVRFVIGGFEKWVAEERPLEGSEGRSADELRQVPDFPNKNELLDTPDVLALLEKRPDILFVDVRYPMEFEQLGHLPGAVNLTLRKMTTPEMEKAFSDLPKRPIIASCYDKRSSFFALILGLRLSRLGYEFLGRYTTPESFSLPAQDKPHIAAWKAAHAERSLVTIAAEPLKGSLSALQSALGSLALAIGALVLAMRAVLLPWTLKADRDRIVQQRIDPLLAAVKAEHAHDPESRSRATMQLLREHRIRPVVSLLGTFILLVLFTLFFSVVDQASRTSEESFLWIKSIGAPDSTRILPIIVGLLVAAMIAVTGKQLTRTRTIASAVAGAALCAIAWNLRAGVDLYLASNLALLIAQSLLVKRWLERSAEERRKARAIRRYAEVPVAPLSETHLALDCGNKAARLGRMMQARLPVPDGFVINTRSIDVWLKTRYWPVATRRAIDRAQSRLSSGPVAVRSSGINEDGADKSYAGVFESILKVKPDGLFEAIETVARSLSSLRAQAYSNRGNESGCIIVQRMVNAEYAGVLFTEHPGESGSALVELVAGLGDDLVSGRAEPLTLRLGRYTGRLLEEPSDVGANRKSSPIDLAPLFQLGRRVEELFGKPQDIEWAYADGEFFLLQARDITRLSRQGEDARALRERERRRLLEIARRSAPTIKRGAAIHRDAATILPGAASSKLIAAETKSLCEHDREELFIENELSELLPEPTPFSLAWMDRLWAHGGTTHRACRELGIPYDVSPDSPPYVVSAFGVLRVNQWEEKRRLSKGPGIVASFRLTRAGEEIERRFREGFLPAFLKEARLRDALDLDRLTLAELVDLFDEMRRKFVEENYLNAELVNVAADFYFKTAVRELEKRGLHPAEHLSHLPQTVVNEAMELLSAIGRGEAESAAFMRIFGHRAPQDYELGQPRYSENPELVATMAKRSAGAVKHVQEAPPAPKQRVLVHAIERARRYQALKEEAKHHVLRDLAFVRKLLLEIGRRLEVGDGIFSLTPDEVARIGEPSFRRREASDLIRARQEESEALAELHMPAVITLSQLESLDVERGSTVLLPPATGALSGTRVSGRNEITGRARVLRDSSEIDSFNRGEILVARFTDPTWMPVFPLAGGIITEVGGWLSHAAIQAREYDINAIVGARGALDAISTGDLVCLRADGSIERVSERRTETRIRIHAPVTVNREKESLQALLADVSVRGALLLVAGHTLEIGEDLELSSAPNATRLQATIIRNGIPGVYGLLFRDHVERARSEELRAIGEDLPDLIQERISTAPAAVQESSE
jgi:membrane protein insertase Oxa1/YidC/SpoIIIJ/rhodanese-related sulfurtransferase/phosphohistidine swiveling domain-containing protein